MLHWLKEDWRIAVQKDAQALIDSLKGQTDVDSLFCMAVAHDHLGDFQMAERSLKEALQKNLSHIASVYMLGLMALQRGREAEARNYLKRGLRLDPQASQNALFLLRELKQIFTNSMKATDSSVWLLTELVAMKKSTETARFQLGKLLFEKSAYEDAAKHLLSALNEPELSGEATEYLSYIYEHLYKGDELIERTLELAELVRDRSDLFFNLAMVCQHDQRKLELALHFFYLASKEDPADPGLKFSLEQAAIEMMNEVQKTATPDRELLLMFAHLYQGSLGVAKRYAQGLKELKFPDSFENRMPEKLWQRWLLKDNGILGQALQSWFGTGAKVKPLRSIGRL
jgi:tetratricopeptide (TPR) repeat protein